MFSQGRVSSSGSAGCRTPGVDRRRRSGHRRPRRRSPIRRNKCKRASRSSRRSAASATGAMRWAARPDPISPARRLSQRTCAATRSVRSCATGAPTRACRRSTCPTRTSRRIVAFIHDTKTKAASLEGDRRTVEVADLQTGNADAGKRYFNGAGGCATCHSPTGDFAGLATRLQGLQLMQRMLYPIARWPRAARRGRPEGHGHARRPAQTIAGTARFPRRVHDRPRWTMPDGVARRFRPLR